MCYQNKIIPSFIDEDLGINNFCAKIIINGEVFSEGYGKNLEEAKEKAAEKGLDKIKNMNINK